MYTIYNVFNTPPLGVAESSEKVFFSCTIIGNWDDSSLSDRISLLGENIIYRYKYTVTSKVTDTDFSLKCLKVQIVKMLAISRRNLRNVENNVS